MASDEAKLQQISIEIHDTETDGKRENEKVYLDSGVTRRH
jgi:hypothetical protein